MTIKQIKQLYRIKDNETLGPSKHLIIVIRFFWCDLDSRISLDPRRNGLKEIPVQLFVDFFYKYRKYSIDRCLPKNKTLK